jgi:hypothetical protein
VRVLKLGTVNFDYVAGIPKKHFGGSFHYAGLAGTGWSKKQHRSDWTMEWVHASQKGLVNIADLADSSFLSNNPGLKLFGKVFCSADFRSGSKIWLG